MTLSDDESLAFFLDRLADEAAKAIMPHFRASTAVTNKATAHFDPVTASRSRRRGGDAAAHRGHLSRGTASSARSMDLERADARFVWVLDPIDGTRAFITGLPVWGHADRPPRGGQAAGSG